MSHTDGEISNIEVDKLKERRSFRIKWVNLIGVVVPICTLIIVAAVFATMLIKGEADSLVTSLVIISSVMCLYAVFILTTDLKNRKRIAEENKRLEEDNQIFNEENRKAFEEISEIKDIIASANMGTWRIELFKNEEPRMYVDEKMKELLGIAGMERTPEKTYIDWFSHIKPDAIPSVIQSVERMKQGYFDENTYLWGHPTKGVRYVRCGGTSCKLPSGYVLRGYHYDVDEVVRKEQNQKLRLKNAMEEKEEYYSTLGALGDIFYSMHVLNLVEDTAYEYNARDLVKEIVNHRDGAVEMMIQVMTSVTKEEFLDAALEFTDLTTVASRMQNKKIITKELVGKNTGWFLASFITMETDVTGKPTKVIFATRIIDEEKKQEEKLIYKSQTDELTGFYNRRAYEEDIYANEGIPKEDGFVYLSLDVNGLKVINDTLGHAAGDELITGACECMKKALGSYGKLYRVGGDEFVAIIFSNKEKLRGILSDFDDMVAGWTGRLIDNISVAYGYVTKEEEPSMTVREMSVLADKRMYEAKELHYKKKGMDRRGQRDAHKALCELYTKILKVNITEDTYQIINMDEKEQTKEMGFAEKISKWLSDFGKTGQVHPDDLPEYLKLTDLQYMREYFSNEKTSLCIFYRRRYEDTFKQVMMEIIPAYDYSHTNQSLYLYVKNIDK